MTSKHKLILKIILILIMLFWLGIKSSNSFFNGLTGIAWAWLVHIQFRNKSFEELSPRELVLKMIYNGVTIIIFAIAFFN